MLVRRPARRGPGQGPRRQNVLTGNDSVPLGRPHMGLTACLLGMLKLPGAPRCRPYLPLVHLRV